MSVAPFPPLARWLPATTPDLNRRIVERALLDVGLLEIPPGSNRSPVIDAYLQAVGSPVGSCWCAAAVAAWYRDAGAVVPSDAAGACQVWYEMGLDKGTLAHTPAPGAVVLYALDPGRPTHADHMGVVVRVAPIVLTVEGNTSLAGGSDRNGIAVELKAVRESAVLAYLYPQANGLSD